MKKQLSPITQGILSNGFILALVFIVINLTQYMLDIYKTPSWLTFLFLVLIIIGLSLFTKDFRNQKLDGYISYGKAFKYSIKVSMVASITYGFYFFLLIFVIEPNYCETIYKMASETYYEMGMNDTEVEYALNMLKKIQSPPFLVFSSIVGFMIMGTVSSLISALIVKRNEPLI
jgi:hypothetical protein